MSRSETHGVPWLMLGLWALLLVAASASARAVDPVAIRSMLKSSSPARIGVVANDSYPPFLFADGEGRLQGNPADVWQLFQQHTGIQAKLVPMDRLSSRQELESWRADGIATIHRVPACAAPYDFTSPYTTAAVSAVVERCHHGVRDVATLRSFRVDVVRADGCAEQLSALGFGDVVAYPTLESLVNWWTHGDIHIFCMGENPANDHPGGYYAPGQYALVFGVFDPQMQRAVRTGKSAMLTPVQRGMALVAPDERATFAHSGWTIR